MRRVSEQPGFLPPLSRPKLTTAVSTKKTTAEQVQEPDHLEGPNQVPGLSGLLAHTTDSQKNKKGFPPICSSRVKSLPPACSSCGKSFRPTSAQCEKSFTLTCGCCEKIFHQPATLFPTATMSTTTAATGSKSSSPTLQNRYRSLNNWRGLIRCLAPPGRWPMPPFLGPLASVGGLLGDTNPAPAQEVRLLKGEYPTKLRLL